MNPYNPLNDLVRRIGVHGGFVNAHAHFDRAYTIKPKMMSKTHNHLFEKWEYVDNFKRNAGTGEYFENIKKGLQFLANPCGCYKIRTYDFYPVKVAL